ncbi:hypothetical protein KXD93_04650 [Mucilaginibacter sp. BJC16-A38]|uniref:DUF5700 domain-containing putative Zn-dependent protease n=1 Tax=Mucilaginibacter phenanthrenivorans TaxID=1234842 RepID=UPI002158A088|nr:DUF5700 domain-containing putative Zn-dependent protease [Mucilaginibacter phenanthrenivorans]MCR8556915.1 hypothetical protein [Mucilaginibacter phenanthrenivorans]
MNHKCRYLFLLFVLLLSSPVLAQKFNTDAVTKFWQVVDLLKADQPLTDSLWNDYYNLYGNKTYIDNNRSPEQAIEHRKYLGFVFRPSMRDSLSALEKEKKRADNDILKNLLYIQANEKALRNYTREITSPAYVAACAVLAKKYLPPKVNPFPKDLTIYVNAMTFDAAVQSPDMYFGLSIIYEFDRFQKGAIAAHEFHHQLRVNKHLVRQVSAADSTSLSIINQVNSEGIADLIDKTIAVNNSKTLYDADGLLHWLFDDAEKVIGKLDSGFLVNAKNGPDRLSYRDFRKITLYSSGHIPGFYMANIIVRNGGKEQLIAHSDNPFYIFYLYDEAAKKDKAHPVTFSKASMTYLKDLEKRAYGHY